MLEGDIKRWTFQDLEGLVGRAQESRTLEFKRELPPKDGGARSFAKGIAAFANTNGGDFLIGIEAIRGVVTAISGIPAEDPDAYIRQLSDVLATQVEPPLPPVDIRAIRCPTGCWVFVARIPKSWAGPHRTVFDRHFYVRNSAASLPLDVAGLRVAFRGHEDVVERVDGFRRERLTRLIGRTAPVRLKPGPILAVHLAPLPRFVDRNSIDIVQLVTSGTEMPMPLNVPPRSGYPRANLLGFIHFEDDGGEGSTGYGQLFRTGAYEGVAVASGDASGWWFDAGSFGEMIVGAVRRYLNLEAAYGFGFPTVVMVSLSGAENLSLRVPTEFRSGYYPTPALREATVTFPEILLAERPADLPTVLRPLLNSIWNAFAWPTCSLFDGAGQWRGPQM